MLDQEIAPVPCTKTVFYLWIKLDQPKIYNNDSSSKRKWKRIKTNGIVALTGIETPFVSLIYDLAQGGVSFLHATEIIEEELHMDILIFDILLDFEYFINQIKGSVKGRQLVLDPKSNVPVWRYHVEFCELDNVKINLLQTFCNIADPSPLPACLTSKYPR